MKIYVGNLSYDMTDDDLNQAFSKFGEVISAGIALDRDTGRSKGFGVVEMANPRQAVDAIEALNGTELGGRTIKVGEFHPRSRNNGGAVSTGSYGGGRNGRNFRGHWWRGDGNRGSWCDRRNDRKADGYGEDRW